MWFMTLKEKGLIVVFLVPFVVTLTYRGEATKQTVAFAVGTCREEERVGSSSPGATPEGESPQAVNNHWTFINALEQAPEFSRCVEAHDRATAEVADEQLVAVFAEGDR